MCLITEQTTPEVLKEDLEVFKIVQLLDDWIRAIHEIFTYKLGRLYTAELGITTEQSCGTDDLVNLVYGNFIERTDNKSKLTNVTTGFHFYTTEERMSGSLLLSKYFKNHVVVKCIIPKGSLIMRDSTGLGVANQIIVKEILS